MKKGTTLFFAIIVAMAMATSCVSSENIHRMVEKQEYQKLRNLMFEEGINPDYVNEEGITPTQLAIQLGHIDIVEFLLGIGADPNFQDAKGESPLFHAVQVGSIEAIETLFRIPETQIDLPNKDGNTALRSALEQDQYAIAELLVAKGANIFHANLNGQTPAEYAILKGETAYKVVATPENVKKEQDDTSLISLATKLGLPKTVADLIDKGSPVQFGKINGENLLEYALLQAKDPRFAEITILFAEKGVKILAKEFAYIDYYVNAPRTAGFYSQGGFPLHKAAAAGHLGFVQYFKERDFDIDKKDDNAISALNTALQAKQYDVARYLIEEKGDVNSRTPLGDTPLTLVLKDKENKPNDLAQLIINAGSEINIQNYWGSSPLLLAIQNDFSFETISMLFDEKGSSAIARNNDGVTPLHAAIAVGNKAVIQKVLEIDNNINAVDNAGNTPFFMAVARGFEFLSWFIDNMNVYTKDEKGNSILHLAIQRNSDPDLIKLLLVKGIPLNQKNINGDTPFILAVRNNNTEISTLLLEAGADLFIENKNKQNPMSIALTQPWNAEGSWVSSEKFINARDFAGNTPLHWAVNYDRMDVAQQILALGTNINQMNNYGRTPLHSAILKENRDMITLLIEKGANTNARDYAGNTVYHYMVTNDSVALVDLFKPYNIDLNTANIYGKTPLHEAIIRNSVDMTKMLLENQASVHAKDNFGRTPVHFAATSGNLAILQLLKIAEAPFSQRDNEGQTPLHNGVASNQQAVTTYLVCNDADIYAANSLGETPISNVLKSNDITEWFVDSIIVNKPDNKGRYPIHIATIEKASPDTVRTLIEKGAKINLKDMEGKTPLSYAMELESLEVAQILIANGADIFSPDKRGTTPFDIAIRGGEKTLDWFINRSNITYTDNQGNTPLHHAAIDHNNSLYQYLIKRGASPSVFNKDGYTPDAILQMAPMQ